MCDSIFFFCKNLEILKASAYAKGSVTIVWAVFSTMPVLGNVIYRDVTHDRDAAQLWQPQENQKYI